MNLTDTEILKFQMGSPILLEDICAIYPVTLRQIVEIGYDNFLQYLNVITTTKPLTVDIKDVHLKQILDGLSDFTYLLMMVTMDAKVNETLRGAFRFFTHEKNILFSLDPAQIIIGPAQEKHLITEDKFYDLQRIIRRMYFLDVEGEEIIIYDDDLPQTKALKMQMRANREKVRKANAAKTQQEKSNLSFSDLIGSLALGQVGLNMINVWDMTYYAFHDQLKRMGWRDQFNINSQAALAGAKMTKSQLRHWMRSIASGEKNN